MKAKVRGKLHIHLLSNQSKQPRIAEVNDGAELDNGDTEREEERREMEVNDGGHMDEASLPNMPAVAAGS